MGDRIRLALRSLPRDVVALIGAHRTLVLASIVGGTGVAVGVFLPPGGPALAWFVPLVEGATVLSLLVAGAMAGADVIARQERSALPYVGIGATVATLWLAHLFSFTGLLLPALIRSPSFHKLYSSSVVGVANRSQGSKRSLGCLTADSHRDGPRRELAQFETGGGRDGNDPSVDIGKDADQRF